MARKTKDQALETRHLILDTAERLFSEKGVARTSLAEIAAAADVTRGAIYWHFKDKIDLFDAMLERMTLPIEEMLIEHAPMQAEDPLGYLRRAAFNVVRRTALDASRQRVFEIVMFKCEFVDEMHAVRERMASARDACLADIEAAVRAAKRKGQLPKATNPRRAAIGLHALIDGLIANWVIDPTRFSLEREGPRLVEMFIDGLACAGKA